MWSFNCCFLFLYRLRHIFAVTSLWLEDILSKEENALQFKALFIHSLFIITQSAGAVEYTDCFSAEG